MNQQRPATKIELLYLVDCEDARHVQGEEGDFFVVDFGVGGFLVVVGLGSGFAGILYAASGGLPVPGEGDVGAVVKFES
jgi:hypothetical protein